MKKNFFKKLVALILTLSLSLGVSFSISAINTTDSIDKDIIAQRIDNTTFFIRKTYSDLKSETILFENNKAIQMSLYDVSTNTINSLDLKNSNIEDINKFIKNFRLYYSVLTKDLCINSEYINMIKGNTLDSNMVLTSAFYAPNIGNEPMTDDGLANSGLNDGFKLLGNARNVSGNYGATIYRKLDQKYLGKEKDFTFTKGELLADVINIMATFLDPTGVSKALLVLDITNKVISYTQSVAVDSFGFLYDYKIHAGTGNDRYSYKLALTAYRNKKYHKVYNQTNGKLEWILKREETLPIGTNYDWINAAINNRKRGVVGGYK